MRRGARPGCREGTRLARGSLVVSMLVCVVLASARDVMAQAPVQHGEAGVHAARLNGDRTAVRIYRDGLRAVVAYVDARPDLVPREPAAAPRLLGPDARDAVRRTWHRFLDYLLALDAVGKAAATAEGSPASARELAFVIRHAAFAAQYRSALEWLDRLDRDPGLPPLLDEAIPELGLPAGSYARVRVRFLNVRRATEFAALALLARQNTGSQAPELRAAIAEDSDAIWRMGRGRGEVLTAKHASRVVQDTGFAAWFPVQAGAARLMAHRAVWRPGRTLIASAQVAALVPRLAPGDLLLVRRHWYLSDIGLPGFWPHAALYVGTPEDRRQLAANADLRAWVRDRGQADGDLETLLRTAHPTPYAAHHRPEQGRPRGVLEAISDGVGFTSLERLTADALAVLRPRLPAAARASALLRAFSYVGRPYDFDFDFRTDAALVCTELVYKAYEPTAAGPGLRWDVPELLGRPVLPANELARQFDTAFGTPAQQLDLVLFLDGQERAGTAVERDVEAFRQSWRRPKWHLLTPP